MSAFDRWLDPLGARLDGLMLRRGRLRGETDARIAALNDGARLERVRALEARYADPSLLAFPGPFLAPGPVILPERGPAPFGGETLRWPSEVVPFNPEVATLYPPDPANATAWATRFPCGVAGAPTLVVVHGYGGGRLWIERSIWPIRTWRRAGLDVVLATLPLHANRATKPTFTPPFPASDPRRTHEGFRQAVSDLTSLLAWSRAQGARRVGIVGMSLGGYTAALLATLPGIGLDFAGMVIPLSSLSDFALRHGRLGHGDDATTLAAALDRVYGPSSPFARPAAIAPERVCVLAARADRITGVAQAEALARHFGVTAHIGPGSHLLHRHLAWDALTAHAVRALS